MVTLFYNGLDSAGNGLQITAGPTTIRGLAIEGFPEAGIQVTGGPGT